jgi:muramoyltetrapeptide carboxypeptidase
MFARHRYLAGEDPRRLAELQTALDDPTAGALWVARGGYGAARLLPHLDRRAVHRAGKWLVGFSDVTALHAAWSTAGVASLHGANITTLDSWSQPARDELLQTLMQGPGDDAEQSPTRRFAGVGLHGHTVATGPLLGGNLTVLASLAGTGALPPMGGCVVLLEDVGERPYRLDRSLTQLVQAGTFDGVAAFAVGQLSRCWSAGGEDDEEALEVVLSVLAPLAVPVVGRLPIGHEPSSRAAALGSRATVDPTAGTLTLAW